MSRDGLRNGGPPDGKGEWVLLGLAIVMAALVVWVALDPSASFTLQELTDLLEWFADVVGRIFDQPGPL